ncbi:branched-chain amino acid ABC transporter ATP-binding protein [Archaeoglobus profundus]|uniref:ABC transporter related protein n=1 Tax=Archaeoglobus profundus (strain DSM 5631 / JCM 9629 / NBRC 100127 / Av18) TaxID=572546 RepID=D2RE29_ARCPA|nr:ABC transporter ATP-binding protein [Archaeoglobus profundus]ADB58373.1 ABC transporter related protein [Archaeoglobus profundus DSM 5631]
MIKIENLNAGYRELHILFDINAEMPKNKITTIVGPNGSGKSTLLKAIYGLATIYSGSVKLDGKDITHVPPHDKARLGLAYLPQIENVFVNLTVMENLKIAGYILEKNELEERIKMALDFFPELKYYTNRKAGTLSGGERQFLAIAMALVKNAKVIMLDEPTAQLSPKLAETVFQKIVELRDELGLTVVLVEQNAKRALEISDKAYMLISGRVVFEGSARDLLEHEKFERYCMGLT